MKKGKRMKKILLTIIVLTIGLSAYPYEENKKACDGGDAIGCEYYTMEVKKRDGR